MKLSKIIQIIKNRRSSSFNEMELLIIFTLAEIKQGSRNQIYAMTGGNHTMMSAKIRKLSRDGFVHTAGHFIGLNNKQQDLFKLTNQGEAKAVELLCLNGGH